MSQSQLGFLDDIWKAIEKPFKKLGRKLEEEIKRFGRKFDQEFRELIGKRDVNGRIDRNLANGLSPIATMALLTSGSVVLVQDIPAPAFFKSGNFYAASIRVPTGVLILPAGAAESALINLPELIELSADMLPVDQEFSTLIANVSGRGAQNLFSNELRIGLSAISGGERGSTIDALISDAMAEVYALPDGAGPVNEVTAKTNPAGLLLAAAAIGSLML